MKEIYLGNLTVLNNGNELENLNIPAIKGDTGNGIQSIIYDRTVGSTKYYKVIYTNGNTDEISVENGVGDMLKYIYDTNANGIVDNAEKVNNHTVEKDVPSNAVFTDTIYDDTQVKSDIQANSTAITNLQNAGYITKDVNNLTNYTLTTETGSQIVLTINSSDFKMTATLKDKNGNIVDTSNVIDLPLETMVVGASYDNNTKEVVLTLQNGTTTRFSVADLVDGLINQTQLEEVTGSLSDLQTTNKNNLVSAINEINSTNIIDIIYPVGSIYMSKNSTSPATLFGGTWNQIKDSYLVCAGDTYIAGVTGGSRTKTLAVENLPSHTHSLNSHTHSLNSHTHTYDKVKSPTGGTELTEKQIPHSFWHTNYDGDMDSLNRSFSNGADFGIKANPNSNKGASHSHTVSTESKNTGTATGSTGASSGNTGSTGSGTAFNIDPPYIPVYVWERTA